MVKFLPMLMDPDDPKGLAKGILRIIHRSMRPYLILITGMPQTRKSTMAIRIAMDAQPDWDMSKQMALLKGEDYIRALMNTELTRGDVVVLDEVQTGLSHREWFSFINKALNSIIQTHGWRGLIVIVTTPYAKYVDSDTRALFNMWIRTMDTNDSERWAKIKVYTLIQNEYISDREKKINIITLRPVNIHKPWQIIDSIRLDYPPDDVMERYYAWSSEMKTALTANLAATAKRIDKKDMDANFDAMAEADKIIARIEAGDRHFVKSHGGRAYININTVRNELKIGMGRGRDVKEAIENKLGGRLNEFVS